MMVTKSPARADGNRHPNVKHACIVCWKDKPLVHAHSRVPVGRNLKNVTPVDSAVQNTIFIYIVSKSSIC